ncbi:hypothetical protein WL1483_1447 [Aeromonas schubertii]|uniref:Uncharacterized protein n=2 Tax=Aeromonas schubertii TaxID=652 RepID=A0A0S2SGR7_9GAMM|nr:hypothetical protein WL1483_1447 [Aeromonas schubertii]
MLPLLLLPLAIQAAEPVWITVGSDAGPELRRVGAEVAPLFSAKGVPSSWPGSSPASWPPSPP